MKPTARPVQQLTPNSIARSFARSGKKHLFLTGERGAGKTTLFGKLFPLLDPQMPGLTTWAVPQQGVYLRENRTGQTAPIGTFDPWAIGRKMRPLEDGFLQLGVPALLRCMEAPGAWAAVDEIGFLETDVPAYRGALEQLLTQKRVLAVVRKDTPAFLQALCHREDAFVLDLDNPLPALGCVILASGLGRRFGGNKLLADFDGRPLLTYILDATQDIFSQRVVVTRHAEVQTLCQARGIPTVLHDQPHRSDTVRLGLDALPPDLTGCLFCPGDQPLVTRNSILALALCAAQEPNAIWRLSYGDSVGSPALFPQTDFADLLHLPAGKGGNVLFQRHPDRVRLLQAETPEELADIDCPQSLEDLLQKKTT